MARNETAGRLNREQNPPPGEMPGYNPQFYDESGHAVDVTEKNPFPSALYNKTESGIWLPVSSSNPIHTKDNEAKGATNQIKQTIDNLTESQKLKTNDAGTQGKIDQLKQSIDDLNENQKNINKKINVLAGDKAIYGVRWNKVSSPTMIRTDEAQGLVANAGIDGQSVTNDFDNLPIWGEMGEVTDDIGNTFVKIPKFYIQKKSGKGFYVLRISKHHHTGFYLPWIFWDFNNNKELDYALIGKYEGFVEDVRLTSKAGVHPTVEQNIVEFRGYATENGPGYQQNDIHMIDALQALFFIEFATLNTQSIMQGHVSANYSNNHTVTVAESNANRAIVSNSTASGYEAGQTIGIGVNNYSNSVTGTSRLITKVESYDSSNTAIYFDGDPVSTSVGDVIANRSVITGFSSEILASSGTVNANDGWNGISYRGIENPYGNIYEWIDGVNINSHQAWVARNADDYASNVFAKPYEKLGYVNHDANGYVKEMGYDANHPYAEFPIEVGAGTSTYYADYYYQNTGQRVARFGGYWSTGSSAGLSLWNFTSTSSNRSATSGGRLLKKPL
ncbi:hypothetical protein SPD48_09475 [Pseudogracilibacillus sp. SE30717A]|uniref:hypothetical protein n=1 Tax=Pseudogracilibacillus sp. SE30717A TaxID=3098293 RepID=UPI00300DC4CE